MDGKGLLPSTSLLFPFALIPNFSVCLSPVNPPDLSARPAREGRVQTGLMSMFRQDLSRLCLWCDTEGGALCQMWKGTACGSVWSQMWGAQDMVWLSARYGGNSPWQFLVPDVEGSGYGGAQCQTWQKYLNAGGWNCSRHGGHGALVPDVEGMAGCSVPDVEGTACGSFWYQMWRAWCLGARWEGTAHDSFWHQMWRAQPMALGSLPGRTPGCTAWAGSPLQRPALSHIPAPQTRVMKRSCSKPRKPGQNGINAKQNDVENTGKECSPG